MKQFLILFVSAFCLIALTSSPAMAQSNNDSYQKEKADTAKIQGILGSQTHSGSECGHNRAQSGGRPSYRIIIVDLDLTKLPTFEGQAMSFQATVRADVNAPYKKSHTFKFKKSGKGKLNPSNWYVDVPCYAEEATFTINIDYRDGKSGKFKPLKISPKANQLKLKVDFRAEKIYTLGQGQKLLGSFNKSLKAANESSQTAGLKIKVE